MSESNKNMKVSTETGSRKELVLIRSSHAFKTKVSKLV